jgi:peptidoglycan hydrolase CwlO-like protein
MTFSLPFVLFSSVARKKTKLIQKLSEEEKNQIIADAIEKQIKSCETNIPYCEQEIEKLQKDIQELQESIESEKKEIIELQKKMSML